MEKILNFLNSKKGPWVIFLAWCLFISHLWLPRTWSFFGSNDWDLTYSMFEVARKSIMEYGQWPQWNPWMALGSDLNANPQSVHMSIFFIPIWLLGTFYGYKLAILLAMLIGCFGSFNWFRALNNDRLFSVSAALLFVSATYFSSHIFIAGHSNVLYLYLIPWLAYSFLKLRSRYHFGYLLLAIFILAQMIAGGAPIVFLISVTMLVAGIIGDSWINRKYTLIIPLILTIAGAILLNLWKLLPGFELWSQTPRLVSDPSGINPIQWLESLAGFSFRTGTWHAHYEYNLGFNLILLGTIAYYRKQIIGWQRWGLLLLVLIWFCLGNTPEWINPWYWLNHYLPPFNSMRAPSRFGIVIVFGLLSALVFAIRNVQEKSLLGVILFAAALGQGLAFHAESSFISDTPQYSNPQFYIQNKRIPEITTLYKTGTSQFEVIRKNNLVPNAYEPLNLSHIHDTLPTLISGGHFVKFTPNFFEIEGHDSMVIINQRYHPNWKIFGPGELINYHGLLAINKCKGSRILNYHNPLISKGMWLGLLVLPFLGISHLLLRKRKT